jgi:hypothetical protein
VGAGVASHPPGAGFPSVFARVRVTIRRDRVTEGSMGFYVFEDEKRVRLDKDEIVEIRAK